MRFLEKNISWLIIAVLGALVLASSRFNEWFANFSGVSSKTTGGATIEDNIAERYAEQLYNAMAGMGTDEGAIDSVFRKLSNRADYNKVYNAFGKRQYSQTFGNVGDPVSSSRYDLTQWLAYELTTEERERLIENNPNINF